MATTLLMTGVYADTSMEDGFVRVADSGSPVSTLFMTKATFKALSFHDAGDSLIRMFDMMETKSPGTYAIPRAVLEPDAAADVQLAVTLLDPPAEGCTMPGCLQDVVSTERGFPLCQRHDDLMQDWDSLVA